MNRSSKLVSNTLILSLGTVGSKMIQYLLLPYYTNVLDTAEYGIVDNLQNIASLLIPIVSMTISEAVFRYAMDRQYDPRAVFSNGNIINLVGAALSLAVAFLLMPFIRGADMLQYVFTVVVYVCVNMFRTNCSLYVKAINKTMLFTVDNMLLTAVTVGSNIVFLSVLKLGIVGYMLGYIVGNAASALFLIIAARLDRAFSFRYFAKDICRTLFIFSVPLIPNTVCWWISNSSNRFMISYFIDVSENGVFAIAYKIPTIITIVIGVLMQAWQISANEAAEDKNLQRYYTQMYEIIDAMVVMMSGFSILASKVVVDLMATDAYARAWQFVPMLVASVYYYSKAQLLGTIYTTFKKTGMAFVTNFIAAAVNIALNYLLIRAWGSALGAAVSTCVSYCVLCYVRKWDTRRHITLQNSMVLETVTGLLLLAEAVIFTWFNEYWYLSAACLMVLILLHVKTLWRIAKKCLSIVRRRV